MGVQQAVSFYSINFIYGCELYRNSYGEVSFWVILWIKAYRFRHKTNRSRPVQLALNYVVNGSSSITNLESTCLNSSDCRRSNDDLHISRNHFANIINKYAGYCRPTLYNMPTTISEMNKRSYHIAQTHKPSFCLQSCL